MTVISYPLEIFRRLNSLVTAVYAQDIVRTVISNDRIPKTRKTRSLAELAKDNHTFLPVRDFSSFKLPSYCILRAWHSPRCIKQRYKPKNSQNAIIVDFNEIWPQFSTRLRYFDVQTPFYGILRAWHSAHCNKQRYKPKNAQNAIIRRFWRKMTVISYPFEILQRLISQITAFYAQNIVHAVLSFESC
jgi:hypothetical protein